MCRLFGFRSVIQSQVHRSLVAAENALAVQSHKHRDGWGVAYYVADAPHVIKSTSPAVDDHIFERVSGIVASETVLAHLRLASVGEQNILNTHPFQHGHWTFAHNGEVGEYATVREDLRAEVAPNLKRFILGDTDSEVLFFLFLTFLSRVTDLHRKGTPFEVVAGALSQMVARVRTIAPTDDPEHHKLSFIVTDGHTLVGMRNVTPLLFSTYKTRCLDRETCPFLDTTCEAPSDTGFVNHLIVSSERLQGDNTWIELGSGELVGVDWRMALHRGVARPDGSVMLHGDALYEPASVDLATHE